MSYLHSLKQKNSEMLTLNGAKNWSTTGNACLDLFAVAGGMRYRKPVELIRLFERAYIEEPDTAMKLLFYIRDIRGGMGERKIFRTLIRHVAKVWPESAKKNICLISEYGRFDDLFCLLGTPAEEEVLKVVRAQLDADLASFEERKKGNPNAHISLLAKWMPSINTSSPKTRALAYRLANALGMKPVQYRKTLTALRANICLTERYLGTVVRQASGVTAKEWIDRALIARIKVELRHTDKSVARISEEMNFPNPSFFSKYFKRLTQKTPAEYRNSY